MFTGKSQNRTAYYH